MPIYELQEDKGFERLPANEDLEAKVIDITEQTFDDWDNPAKKVKKLNFKFEITGGEHAGRWAWGKTSTVFSQNENCKLRSWAMEILSVDTLPDGFKLDTDMLLDIPCRIRLEHYTYEKDGKPKDGERVSDVLRSVRGEGQDAEEIF